MVIYDLCCEFEHEFEGWFKNNDEFIEQQRSGLLTCPYCDSGVVHKKLSAPKVARKSNTVSQTSKAKDNVSNDKSVTDKSLVVGDSESERFANLQTMLNKVHNYIDDNFQDVGNRFADEAISMHRGEKPAENIKGTVSREKMAELVDEGVQATPLPPKPIDKKKIN